MKRNKEIMDKQNICWNVLEVMINLTNSNIGNTSCDVDEEALANAIKQLRMIGQDCQQEGLMVYDGDEELYNINENWLKTVTRHLERKYKKLERQSRERWQPPFVQLPRRRERRMRIGRMFK
jgi:hypothetical protein